MASTVRERPPRMSANGSEPPRTSPPRGWRAAADAVEPPVRWQPPSRPTRTSPPRRSSPPATVPSSRSRPPAAGPRTRTSSAASSARPRQTAQALLAVAEVARTRLLRAAGDDRRPARGRRPGRHEQPRPAAVRVVLRRAAGVYARLDVEPALPRTGERRVGGRRTSTSTRRCGRRSRACATRTRCSMHVGHDEVVVTTLDGSAVERRRCRCPTRWLKGFAEVQVAASRMVLRARADRARGAAVPAEPAARRRRAGVAWAAPAGRALRLASRADDAAVCLAGPERLRLLERLLRVRDARCGSTGRRGRSAGARGAESSAWELVLDGARVVFAVSPELAPRLLRRGRRPRRARSGADEDVVEDVADDLHGEPAIDVAATAERLGVPRPQRAVGARRARRRRPRRLRPRDGARSSTASCPTTARVLERMQPAPARRPEARRGGRASASTATSATRSQRRGRVPRPLRAGRRCAAPARGSRATAASAARASTSSPPSSRGGRPACR